MHVQGNATYIDDMPVPEETLHVAFALSDVAHGKINRIDIKKAKKWVIKQRLFFPGFSGFFQCLYAIFGGTPKSGRFF